MSWAAETTISSKGQIVIPAEIRRRYGIKEGQRFKVLEEEGEIRLIPVRTLSIKEARGSLKTGKSVKELLREGRREDASHEKRLEKEFVKKRTV